MRIEELYERHIRRLPRRQRLRLLSLTAKGLAEEKPSRRKRTHSIMDLAGMGKDMWDSVDVEKYVSSLRNEWGPARS